WSPGRYVAVRSVSHISDFFFQAEDGIRADGVVRVTIQDEGVGIPPELQREIFGKFVRGHATAEGIEGSGLGLAISRSLVEAHGGSIDFESTKGRGSTFWFELPTASSR